jgi:hypothetical protein
LYDVASSCARLTTCRPSGSSPATACTREGTHSRAATSCAACTGHGTAQPVCMQLHTAHSTPKGWRDHMPCCGSRRCPAQILRFCHSCVDDRTHDALGLPVCPTHHAHVLVHIVYPLVGALHQQLGHHQLLYCLQQQTIRAVLGIKGSTCCLLLLLGATHTAYKGCNAHALGGGVPHSTRLLQTYQHHAILAAYAHGSAARGQETASDKDMTRVKPPCRSSSA